MSAVAPGDRMKLAQEGQPVDADAGDRVRLDRIRDRLFGHRTFRPPAVERSMKGCQRDHGCVNVNRARRISRPAGQIFEGQDIHAVDRVRCEAHRHEEPGEGRQLHRPA